MCKTKEDSVYYKRVFSEIMIRETKHYYEDHWLF